METVGNSKFGRVAKKFQELSGFWKFLTVLLAILTLVGKPIADSTINRRVINYSIGSVTSMGAGSSVSLAIENGGRVNIDEVHISTGDLHSTIQNIDVLDPREHMLIVDGGVGFTYTIFKLPRLPGGHRQVLILSSNGRFQPSEERMLVTSNGASVKFSPNMDMTPGRNVAASSILMASDPLLWLFLVWLLITIVVAAALSRKLWREWKIHRAIKRYEAGTRDS